MTTRQIPMPDNSQHPQRVSSISTSGFKVAYLEPAWAQAAVTTVQFALMPQTSAMISWLAERWQSDESTVMADMLVFVSCGRHRLTQLTQHNAQPDQDASQSSLTTAQVRLLAPCVHKLHSMTELHWCSDERSTGMLLHEHLIGRFNPQLASVSDVDPDGQLLAKDDDDIKIHLTGSMTANAEELALAHELTRSDVLRNLLLLHVYGRLRYEQWTSEGSWRPKRKAAAPERQAYMEGSIKLSRERHSSGEGDADEPFGSDEPKQAPRTEFILSHGKSTDATRVFLPALLKQRLEALATSKGLRVSEYCRRQLAVLL